MTNFDRNDLEHLLGEAIYIAARVHRFQKDKSGVCYTLHPLQVMLSDGPDIDRRRMIVRVLHDVKEDIKKSGLSVRERQELLDHIDSTFPQDIVDALNALNHDKSTPYEGYIEIVAAAGFLARDGKIADIEHNSDPRRLPLGAIEEKDLDRWYKYRKAHARLERED